jgi:exodeoxyribonuclease V alpha subunit
MKPSIAALIEKARANHAKNLELQKASQVGASPQGESTLQSSSNLVPKSLAPATISHSILSQQVKPSPPKMGQILTASSQFQSTTGVPLNDKQTSAVELAMRGKSFNLIGAAGTGKTTTTREVIGQLVRLPHISPVRRSTKHLIEGAPGIVVISFTNKAVNNLKKFLPEELKKHCLTYHKLLQYAPKRYDIEPGNPMSKQTMRFEPEFGPENPLPHISCIIVEESSMVAEDLHRILLKALPDPSNTQFIFLGDLNQLPPIFGPSILGFKLLELPTVELTHVYRQALESPIITLAHKIREGRGFYANGKGVLPETGFIDDRGEHGKVTIRPWKKKITSASALQTVLKGFLLPVITRDDYDFNENAILCPFNKSFGTIELNRHIADALAKKRNAEVFEVVGRGQRSYWAVGDRVLVDRREAIIIRIEPTPGYSGPIPQPSSNTLNRWGDDGNGEEHHESDDFKLKGEALIDPLDRLENMSMDGEENQKNSASHTITVEFVDSGTTFSASSAGDVNGMLFSYVLTVHKSQGSEWKRVFILLHYSHNTMLSRELLYTAITRAKHELFIICEPDRGPAYNSLTRAAKSPEITGVTLEEKAKFFQAKKKTMKRLADAEQKPEDQTEDDSMEEM